MSTPTSSARPPRASARAAATLPHTATTSPSLWHAAADPLLQEVLDPRGNANDWQAWQKYLQAARPANLRLSHATASPWYWGMHVWSKPAAVTRGRPALRGHALLARAVLTACRTAAPAETIRAVAAEWLRGTSAALCRVELALAALELADGVREQAQRLPRDGWWALLDWLREAASFSEPMPDAEHALVWQLEAGELPLLLACRLPELADCQPLAATGTATLSDGLEQLLDGEGLPQAALIPSFRPLLASWTRARLLMQQQQALPWSAATQQHYEWAVRQSLALSRPDGACLLSAYGMGADLTLLRAALALDAEPEHQRMAERLFAPPMARPDHGKRRKQPAAQTPLPLPAIYSEWSEAAVLAPAWSRHARLAVTHASRSLLMELSLGATSVLRGEWSFEVRLNGTVCQPIDDYEQVCWTSDEEADYLELEIQLDGGVKLERQILLARKDGILLLADAVLAAEPGKLEYRAALPLVPSARFEGSADTHDGMLMGKRRLARVLPLALPEWRADHGRPAGRGGSLAGASGSLELRQEAANTRALFGPLLFDLDQKRTGREATWRHLTVAEARTIQSPDVAVGYRAQLNREHWLMYRSLAERGNRTLMGHNLVSEFMLGRFTSEGVVEPLLEIE